LKAVQLLASLSDSSYGVASIFHLKHGIHKKEDYFHAANSFHINFRRAIYPYKNHITYK